MVWRGSQPSPVAFLQGISQSPPHSIVVVVVEDEVEVEEVVVEVEEVVEVVEVVAREVVVTFST